MPVNAGKHRQMPANPVNPRIMSKRLELRLPPELVSELEARKPKTQSLSRFCALLIEQGLDGSGTLGGPSAAGTPSTSSNGITSIEVNTVVTEALTEEVEAVSPSQKRRKRKPKADGGPEFEAFWRQYLAIKHRANGQTKPAAVEAWGKVTKEITGAQLQAALSAAVNEQARATRETGWAAPFPDCHRWLAKGYWQQHVTSTAAEPLLTLLPDFTPPPEFPDAPF